MFAKLFRRTPSQSASTLARHGASMRKEAWIRLRDERLAELVAGPVSKLGWPRG